MISNVLALYSHSACPPFHLHSSSTGVGWLWLRNGIYGRYGIYGFIARFIWRLLLWNSWEAKHSTANSNLGPGVVAKNLRQLLTAWLPHVRTGKNSTLGCTGLWSGLKACSIIIIIQWTKLHNTRTSRPPKVFKWPRRMLHYSYITML